MSEIKKNDEITVDITDINNLGCGVGRYGGEVVFVRGTVGGDRIRAKIIKVAKNYCVARLLEVLESSPHRITEGVCTAPESCGGCIYRHIDYEYELQLKRNTVINAFRKAGLKDVEVGPVLSARNTDGYRNKAQFPVGRAKDGRLRAGIYASKSHDISGGSDCRLQPPVFGRIADRICALLDERSVAPYDEKSGQGLIRHIYLRRAEMTGQIMVCLAINGVSIPGQDTFCEELTSCFPDIRGIMLNVNTENTNVILGKRYIQLWGEESIEDILCGIKVKIAPSAFYQVNRKGAELLYSVASCLAGENKEGILADLYCGTGTIGLSMAKNFGRVIGIEIVEQAVRCARENAEANGIENAYFFCGDASVTGDILTGAEKELGEKINPDTVIIDPPRKGTTCELIDCLASRKIGKIVYVSCDCTTLARDCAYFALHGYKMSQITPVDMFPRCGHIESVVLLYL